MSAVYCVDTSAWIDLKDIYPKRIFESVWTKIETLVDDNRIISPQEVYAEIEQVDDDLYKWFKNHRQIIRNLDEEQIALAKTIESQFPRLVDPDKEIPVADPFVIALAKIETRNLTMLDSKCIVVSQEKPRSSTASRPKIPDVCEAYDVEHFSIIEFFDNEGWKI